MINLVLLGFGFGLATVLSASQQHQAAATLESIRTEHEELHNELASATKLPGRTGAAASKVAELLHSHFAKEEEFALPPLALLRPLAGGQTPPDAKSTIALTDRLKAEMPVMLGEHKAIVAALADLDRAAAADGHREIHRFVEHLTLHAQHEEEVLYPAAILVGEYLKLRAAR